MNKKEIESTIQSILEEPTSSLPEAPRDAQGRFAPGVSGNPEGRTKGSKNRATIVKQAIENMLVDQLQLSAAELLTIAIDKAKEGDNMMLKLLLDKMLPNRRGDEVDVSTAGNGISITINTTDGRRESKVVNKTAIEAEYEEE